ncbi:hypothetical protein [Priestia endophytica]|uniref:hypothetical protein n=1 Tax=Priestia endophytica TaxID=135735 RepID=UPI001F5B6EA9|nr:hypothetical protein [Priestia endophytica]
MIKLGISSIFLLGMIGIMFLLVFRGKVLSTVKQESRLVKSLQQKSWFHNPYTSGIVLFLWNTVMTAIVALLIFALMITEIYIPYLHIVIFGLGTLACILAWATFSAAWVGSKKSRLTMASIGSSFYVLLGMYGLYEYITLKPSYPGEDVFMAALGFMGVMVVAAVALMTCFLFIGFQKKEATH